MSRTDGPGAESTPDQRVGFTLSTVVDELCHIYGITRRGRHIEALPSRDVVTRMMETLRAVLFPGYFGSSDLRPSTLRYHLGHALDDVQRTMQLQIVRGLAFACQDRNSLAEYHERAAELTVSFLEQLPRIERLVSGDVQAAYEGDPAAPSADEAIFCYPGVMAVTNYRIAHELHQLQVPLLPRMISESAHSITGIDIHPGAKIGEHLFIDHGTGVVIGETCEIGDRVRLYQGVTLGAKSFPLDENGHPVKGIPRHPVIEDDVIIYSGATILGRVVIGKGSVIGGNVWLTHSIPPGSSIAVQPPRQELFIQGDGI